MIAPAKPISFQEPCASQDAIEPDNNLGRKTLADANEDRACHPLKSRCCRLYCRSGPKVDQVRIDTLASVQLRENFRGSVAHSSIIDINQFPLVRFQHIPRFQLRKAI